MEVDGKNQHERAVKFDFHTGRWTDEEHRKFLDAYEAMVAVDPARRRWPNVAAAVGTRSTTQCRSHAQKYFTCAEIKRSCEDAKHSRAASRRPE